MLKQHKLKIFVIIFVILIFLPLFYALLYKIYKPRISAFGCFDDCAHFITAYFMLKGKHIYSQIFTNHQPLINFISYFIQFFTAPENIYALILRHRQFVLLFGFIANFLLIIRFGLAGFGFTIIYELSKFYVFGDRFLAESLIVYPLVYMAGLAWKKLINQKIYKFEYGLSAIFAWFIVFMRIPYTLAAIFLLLVLLWQTKREVQALSLGLFVIPTIILLLTLPLPEYIFNVATVNRQTILASEMQSQNLFGAGSFKAFFYPIYLFFNGDWNIFRLLEIRLSIIFLFLSGYLLTKKQYKQILFIWTALALANLRFTKPGRIFYEAFHMADWFGLFVFFIFLKISQIFKFNKKAGYILIIFVFSIFSYFLSSSQNFIYDKIDPHFDLITNYGPAMQVGTVIKQLSKSNDTLFLDGFDDLIYWQADRLSSYKYSWYTSMMPQFKKYKLARKKMFESNPPDFYYGSCPGKNINRLTQKIRKNYLKMYSQGKPTCLYIRKTKISKITQQQWKKAKQSLYELPKKNL